MEAPQKQGIVRKTHQSPALEALLCALNMYNFHCFYTIMLGKLEIISISQMGEIPRSERNL